MLLVHKGTQGLRVLRDHKVLLGLPASRVIQVFKVIPELRAIQELRD